MLVSVITPVYLEPASFLERNAESVKKQNTRHKIEHIVVVDNNISEFRKQDYKNLQKFFKFTLIFHDKNLGLSQARNTAIENSSGDYIMLLDCDDIFAPHRVETQINFMLQNGVDHSYGGYKEVRITFKKPDGRSQQIIPPLKPLPYLLAGENVCYCGSNAIKRSVFDSVGLFDTSMREGAEDMEMWLRIGLAGFTQAGIPEVLYYLGVHGNNMTAKLLRNGGFERAYRYIQEKHCIHFNR